jgi:hypothetical protein
MSVVSILALALLGAPVSQSQERESQRWILDSGAAIYAESMPNAQTAAISICVAAKGSQETLGRHGWRHLLEHLVARGKDGSIDRKLESAGWFLLAETNREFMEFRLEGDPVTLAVALDAVKELLQPRTWTQQEIDAELQTMRQERAVMNSSRHIANALWMSAYGDEGLSPFGDLQAMAKATPTDLQELSKSMFAADQVAVAVCGKVDVAAIRTPLAAALGGLPAKRRATWSARSPLPGEGDAPEAKGAALAVRTGSYGDLSTVAAIAAGLALAAEQRDPYFIYTPTVLSGLAIVGSDTGDSQSLDAMQLAAKGQGARLFPIGKRMAQQWLQGQLEAPASNARLRAALMCQAVGARPETMLENLSNLVYEDFDRALKKFGSDEAFRMIGGRR